MSGDVYIFAVAGDFLCCSRGAHYFLRETVLYIRSVLRTRSGSEMNVHE